MGITEDGCQDEDHRDYEAAYLGPGTPSLDGVFLP